ncbi:MAG TPA: CapA family protein [Gemmatimonadales bacterium]|nr:CapA family protein [Gemmatimonadales bacterium]
MHAVALSLAVWALVQVPVPPPRDTLRVYAVGDLNLGRWITHQRLLKGDTLYPFRVVRDTLKRADLLFGNLESAIAPAGHRYEDTGSVVFTAPPIAADAIAKAGFTVVSDANNHAWDGGRAGVFATLRELDRVGVAHVGTGRTLEEAHRPAWIERRGWRIAVFAMTRAFNPAPYDFYSHEGSKYVAWADSTWLYPAIREVKASGRADLVIVSVHGGTELSDGPDAYLKKFWRGAVDAGADIVLGHHPHVLQRVEWYRGKPIVYSLGNFVFEQTSPWTRLSAIFRFVVTPDGTITADLIPTRANFQVTFAAGAAADSIRRRVGPLAAPTPASDAP